MNVTEERSHYSHFSSVVPFPRAPQEAEWRPVSFRENEGATDTWTEWFCIRRTSAGIEATVCSHFVIAEVPADWLDEDGQPLPAFRDDAGDLLVPAHYNGLAVTGIADGYLLGALTPVEDNNIHLIKDGSETELTAALISMNWSLIPINILESEIAKLFDINAL